MIEFRERQLVWQQKGFHKEKQWKSGVQIIAAPPAISIVKRIPSSTVQESERVNIQQVDVVSTLIKHVLLVSKTKLYYEI